MENSEVISRAFARLKMQEGAACRTTLLQAMPAALDESLRLHKELDGGRHSYHREQANSHACAVAHGGDVIFSEHNDGETETERTYRDNEYGKVATGARESEAQNEAERMAKDNGGAYKGTFLATMDADFLSVRFETEVQETLIGELEGSIAKTFRNVVKNNKAR